MFRTLLRSLGWLTASFAFLATALAVNTVRSDTASATPVAPAPHEVAVAEENPNVKPGLVKWHASLIDAKSAAEKSGKPVLVFHMMGQLDKQFC